MLPESHKSRPSRESGTNRGLRGYLLGLTSLGLHAGIPVAKRRPQVLVQDLRADLEQEMRSPLGPAHLLLLGVTPRLGKNCTLRAGGGAWPKTPCCESRRNTAISAVSGPFRGVDENFSFWSRSRIADGYSRKSKTSSEYDF